MVKIALVRSMAHCFIVALGAAKDLGTLPPLGPLSYRDRGSRHYLGYQSPSIFGVESGLEFRHVAPQIFQSFQPLSF
jgi:hypothetical protein